MEEKKKTTSSNILRQLEDTKNLASRTGQNFDMQTTPENILEDIRNIKISKEKFERENNLNGLISLHSDVVRLYRIADRLCYGSSFFGLSKNRQEIMKSCINELKVLKSSLFHICQTARAKRSEDENEQ